MAIIIKETDNTFCKVCGAREKLVTLLTEEGGVKKTNGAVCGNCQSLIGKWPDKAALIKHLLQNLHSSVFQKVLVKC